MEWIFRLTASAWKLRSSDEDTGCDFFESLKSHPVFLQIYCNELLVGCPSTVYVKKPIIISSHV